LTPPPSIDAGRRRGQAAVEFALTLPLLFLLVLGIVDFGRIFIAANALTQGTREAVRFATLNSSVSHDNLVAIRKQVIDEAGRASITVTDGEISIEYSDTNTTDCGGPSFTPCLVGTARTGNDYTAEPAATGAACPRLDCSAPLIGDLVRVKVNLPWSATTLIIQSLLPPSFTINADSAGTIEQ
jgi:Flp pilus assembly protein TadG